MGRPQVFKQRVSYTGYVDAEEMAQFDQIRHREGKGRSELITELIIEYNRIHSSENEICILDNYVDNSEFIPIPALMSKKEDLLSYIEKENNINELRKVKDQALFFGNRLQIRIDSVSKEQNLDEEKRIKKIRIEKFIQKHDLRNKDPSKMKPWEFSRYKEIMKIQEENRELTLKSEEKIAAAPMRTEL